MDKPRPYVIKPGVGDHPAERCPKHEADEAFGVLRAEMASLRVKAMIVQSLTVAAQVHDGR